MQASPDLCQVLFSLYDCSHCCQVVECDYTCSLDRLGHFRVGKSFSSKLCTLLDRPGKKGKTDQNVRKKHQKVPKSPKSRQNFARQDEAMQQLTRGEVSNLHLRK